MRLRWLLLKLLIGKVLGKQLRQDGEIRDYKIEWLRARMCLVSKSLIRREMEGRMSWSRKKVCRLQFDLISRSYSGIKWGEKAVWIASETRTWFKGRMALMRIIVSRILRLRLKKWPLVTLLIEDPKQQRTGQSWIYKASIRISKSIQLSCSTCKRWQIWIMRDNKRRHMKLE